MKVCRYVLNAKFVDDAKWTEIVISEHYYPCLATLKPLPCHILTLPTASDDLLAEYPALFTEL